MRTVVGVAVICAFLVLPYCAGQSAQPLKIPPCPADAALNYPDNMVRPKYPKDALHYGVAGAVELRAVIAPDGKTEDLAVENGESEFSRAAVAAIQKWRFHPQVRQGRPVKTTYKIHVRFNPILEEANSDVELESPPPEPPPALSLPETYPQDLGPDVHHTFEPGIVPPKALYTLNPEFSEKGRREKEQGLVGILLVVGTDDRPRDLKIICSSAPDENENAIATVQQWKFASGTKDGKPVAVATEVEVSFKLY